MNNEQNEFYSSISKYYAEIFPYQPAQLQFVKSRAGELTEKRILDIGCATGELAFQLALERAKVTAIDLNEDLLGQALGCSGFPARWSGGRSADMTIRGSEPDNYRVASPKFQIGNMLELETDFQPAEFDVVLCFGNTLVHLPTFELMEQMLKGVLTVLKPGGHFLLQILNYDYIFAEQVSELPTIETENIRFIRNYKFEDNCPLIRFQTELILIKEEKTISNETLLLGLKSAKLTELLKEVGFAEIELYSNFKQEPFGGKHLPLVAAGVRV